MGFSNLSLWGCSFRLNVQRDATGLMRHPSQKTKIVRALLQYDQASANQRNQNEILQQLYYGVNSVPLHHGVWRMSFLVYAEKFWLFTDSPRPLEFMIARVEVTLENAGWQPGTDEMKL